MDLKKLVPWNWFKKENGGNGHTIPVKKSMDGTPYSPARIFHDEMDRFFDDFFTGSGFSLPGVGRGLLEGMDSTILKPRLDLGATDNAYTITVEIPGVSEKDICLELAHDTLTICGEKKQETQERNKNFYRVERSYGAFQRTLSLPEDANRENIQADFKNGVLTIRIQRTVLSGTRARQIEITYA